MKMGCRPETSGNRGAVSPLSSRTWEPRAHRIGAASTRVRLRQEEAPPDGAVVASSKGGAVDTIVERCAGLDIGKKSLTACVRTPDGTGGRRSQTRTFRTMTRSLLALRDWLVEQRVSVAGME